MNRKQIKIKREYHQRQIDQLMGQGYGGTDDPAFKRACEQCSKHEEALGLLTAAADEINTKSRKTRRTNKWLSANKRMEMFS